MLACPKAPTDSLIRILQRVAIALCVGASLACNRYPRDESVDNLRNVTDPLALSMTPTLLDPIDAWPVNNDNRIAEAGEALQLNIPLEWSGDTPQTLAFATSQDAPNSSCITSTRITLPATPLPAVSTATPFNVGPVEVFLARTSCPGGIATFNLNVTLVELNEVETIVVEVPVENRDTAISLQSVTIFDGAEGDAALSAGETAILTVGVRNDGVSTIRGASIGEGDAADHQCVKLVTTGTNLPLIPSDADFRAGATIALGASSLGVTADPDCSPGDTLRLALMVEDASGERFFLNWETVLREAPPPVATAE